MDDRLLAVLKRHNPWLEHPEKQSDFLSEGLPDPFVPRARKLKPRPGKALLVVGPRQAGKTTWIRHTLSLCSNPVLLVHAEEPAVKELCRSPAEALDVLSDVMKEDTILLLEEIQHLADGPLFIKGLVDLQPRRRIMATGSSSFQFGSRTRESLAGRAHRVRLLPFSLEEVTATLAQDMLPALNVEAMGRLWERLLVFGGYPGTWFEKDPAAELYHLVEAFALKDVSDLVTIENPAAFRKVLELSAADIGNLVNLSAWAALASVSRAAVGRYLEVAAEAHILRLVHPFAGGKRAEVTARPKVYYLDNGMRNVLFGGFSPSAARPDRGALWENAVYAELIKRTELLDQVLFWRTRSRAEIDFVVRRADQVVGIEVKGQPMARPGVSRAARSFVDAYRPACLGIINRSLRHDLQLGNTPVMFRRPWELDDLLACL